MPKRSKLDFDAMEEEAISIVRAKEHFAELRQEFVKYEKIVLAKRHVPLQLPPRIRVELMNNFFSVTEDDLNLLSEVEVSANVPRVLIFCPPIGDCLECGNELVKRTSCEVRVVDLSGISHGTKLTLRCSQCLITYGYSKYGAAEEGMRFYDSSREYVEATDGVLICKKLCELQSCLANHAWVSFEGFAEAFNESLTDGMTGIDRRIFSSGWYWYEVENELRRIGRIGFLFSRSGTYFEEAIGIIENDRRSSLYEHKCTEGCKNKGCGKMIVFDGIWKLTFNHCMMMSKNVVKDFPVINLPDVCTSEPLYGHAFCKEHVSVIDAYNGTRLENDRVPTKLRDFLKYCGVNLRGDSDEPMDDPQTVAKKVEDIVLHCGLNCVSGESVLNSHSGQDFIASNITSLKDVLSQSDTPTGPTEVMCNKETGEKLPMHQRSRGHMAAVSPGGHILMFNPLYRSESPSQAFLFMLLVLCITAKSLVRSSWSMLWLVYDNMCNILKLKSASSLTLSGSEVGVMWSESQKMIDGLHIKNHRQQSCQDTLHPSRFDDMYPDLKGQRNTMVAEQTFAWLGRYKKIVCAMPKSRHMFYLHRMVVRRNTYTSRCHERGKRIVLPTVKTQFST